MANVVQFHRAADFNPVGVFSIPLTLSGSDLDLTDPAGPTGGYCARALLVGSTAGNLKFKDMLGNTCTQAVAANERLDVGAQYVFNVSNGTTAATVTALG